VCFLVQLKIELQRRAEKRTRLLSWVGLGLMGAQFGFMARLTWWEYSWDIMEPVTYFVGYATTIAMFSYYVITRQVLAKLFSVTEILRTFGGFSGASKREKYTGMLFICMASSRRSNMWQIFKHLLYAVALVWCETSETSTL